MDVSQAHVQQGLELGRDFGMSLEELVGLFDGHLQHIIDVFALVAHCKGVFLVSLAPAGIALDIDRRQEIHLYHLDAGSLALLAAATFDIEGEAPGLEAAHLGVLSLLEKGADVAPYAGESGRIGARAAAYGALVHLHHLVNVFNA